MAGVLVVAARELKDRGMVLVAALVAGLMAILLPIFSSLGRQNARDGRELLAVIFAGVFAMGVATVVGAGMINRELVERRHGFLFARPLSAAAIWCGKVLGCWLLAVGSGLVALGPAVAASRGFHLLGATAGYVDNAAAAAGAAAAVVLLILVAHSIALMVRSHTPWLLAVDAVFGIGVIAMAGLALRSLVVADAPDAAMRGAVAFTAVVFVALFAAGWAQVALGRTDVRRGHRVLSLVLWSVLGVAALATGGYSRWVVAATPTELAGINAHILAPRGDWIVVSGRARGRGDYYPSFLYDTVSGRSVRLEAGPRWLAGAAISADGSRAAWFSHDDDRIGGVHFDEVTTLDLRSSDSSPRATAIVFPRDAVGQLTLSDDGRRLAAMSESTLTVSDLGSRKLVASVRVPERVSYRMFFVPSGDRLRLLGSAWTQGSGSDPADLRLFELDLATRKLEGTGRITKLKFYSWPYVKHDPTGDRLLVVRRDTSAATVTLADARTGITLATLATIAGGAPPRTAFLADGRIVVAEPGTRGARLRAFSSDGMPIRSVDLDPAATVAVGGEAAPGQVAVSLWNRPMGSRNACRTILVDVDNGTVRPLEAGFAPVAAWRWWEISRALSPGSVSARLFYGPARSLALLDPATGLFGTLLGGNQPEQAGE